MIEIAGHDVYPEQKAVLPCPICSESREVFYLGSRNSLTAGDQPRSYVVSGWVCPDCESTLEIRDVDMRGAPEQVTESDMIVVETPEDNR